MGKIKAGQAGPAPQPPGMAVFDPHGVTPIPDEARDSTGWEQFWIWAGANIAPINWVLGALGITLGLNLIETLAVIAVGNVIGCALFGVFNLMGHRTGVNQMLLGRAAFGRHGAVLPAIMQGVLAMGWVSVNTWVVLDLAMGMLGQLGIHGGTGLRYTVAGIIMLVQLALAIFGFYAIRTFEKWTVPATAVVMAVMTAIALTEAHIDWTHGTATTPGAKFTAVTQLLTAIGVGWGMSWLPYSGDYSRFVKRGTSNRVVVWSTAAGMYIPTVWLATLGACLASSGGDGDPSRLVIKTFGAMALPVLLLIMHGPVATNVLNLYSCSLAALTVGLRTARWKVTAFAGLMASVILVILLQSTSFAQSFDNWMSSILVWISPWAGVLMTDFFIRRRGRPNVAALYRLSALPAVNWPGLVSLAAGMAAAWSCQYGLVSVMQGPIAQAMGGVDLSPIAGLVVAGALYALLTRRAFDTVTTDTGEVEPAAAVSLADRAATSNDG